MIKGTTNRTLETVIDELQQNNYPIDVVYDIGANDGRWTKQWKRVFRSTTEIYQFEANPDNKDPRNATKFFNAVLSDVDGNEVELFLPDSTRTENTGVSYYKEMSQQYLQDNVKKEKTITLDTLREKEDIPKPNFVKMDTQGSEVDIINGAKETLSRAYAVMLEMPVMFYNEGAPNFGDYVNAMNDIGFAATAVEHIAIRKGIFNQMDVVFMRKDIINKIHKYKERYTGF